MRRLFIQAVYVPCRFRGTLNHCSCFSMTNRRKIDHPRGSKKSVFYTAMRFNGIAMNSGRCPKRGALMKRNGGMLRPEGLGALIATLFVGCGNPQDGNGDTAPVTYNRTGVCGMSGEGTVTVEGFTGFEEVYLIGDEGLGDDLCRIRSPLTAVGSPTTSCDACEFAFVFERGVSSVVVDIDDACASSALSMDVAGIEGMIGTTVSYGFASEYVGHSSVLMLLDDTTDTWQAVAFASYNDTTGAFGYDRRDGFCGY